LDDGKKIVAELVGLDDFSVAEAVQLSLRF
jgi:hypothetical protein